jgi:hypothetical protein
VTTGDGRRIEMARVTVTPDTVRGVSVRQRLLAERLDRPALAVPDVTSVEVRRVNLARSLGLVAAVGALIAIPALVVGWDHLFDVPALDM